MGTAAIAGIVKSWPGLVASAGAAWRRAARRLRPDPYAQAVALLARGDQWDSTRMSAWQLAQLEDLLRRALRHCPAHREKLRAAGYDGHLSRIEDLAQLPFLTKDELRARGQDFTAADIAPQSLRAITSGGTTGAPARFMVEAGTYDAVFMAWRHAMWRRAGYRRGARALDLTWAFGGSVPLRPSSEAATTYLSIHALEPAAVGRWWRDVSDSRPEFVIGFPSTASALAKLLPGPGALAGVRAVLLASETLTTEQRATLATGFPDARIFQWYGMSEMAGFASGCEHAETFHHWPQSGILEIVGDDGRPVRDAGGTGEIVLTGFANRATPFIRYRTGDRATRGPACTACGRPHVVLATIDGRVGDFLLGRNGRVLPLSALNFHGDEFRRVLAHQFVQDEPGRVVLRFVPLPGFGDADGAAIRGLVCEKLGGDIELALEQVAAIPRTERGKQALILQRVARPETAPAASTPVHAP